GANPVKPLLSRVPGAPATTRETKGGPAGWGRGTKFRGLAATAGGRGDLLPPPRPRSRGAGARGAAGRVSFRAEAAPRVPAPVRPGRRRSAAMACAYGFDANWSHGALTMAESPR